MWYSFCLRNYFFLLFHNFPMHKVYRTNVFLHKVEIRTFHPMNFKSKWEKTTKFNSAHSDNNTDRLIYGLSWQCHFVRYEQSCFSFKNVIHFCFPMLYNNIHSIWTRHTNYQWVARICRKYILKFGNTRTYMYIVHILGINLEKCQ